MENKYPTLISNRRSRELVKKWSKVFNYTYANTSAKCIILEEQEQWLDRTKERIKRFDKITNK